MFPKHSFQVKMVKDSKETTPQPFQLTDINLAAIDKIVRRYSLAAAVGFVLIYASVKTIDTASEVIVNNTNPDR